MLCTPATPCPPVSRRPPLGRAAGRDRRRGGRGQPGQVAGYRHDLDQALDRQRETGRLADRQRRRQDALHTRDQLAAAEAGLRDRRAELAAAARAAEVAHALTEAERTAARSPGRAAKGAAGSAPDAVDVGETVLGVADFERVGGKPARLDLEAHPGGGMEQGRLGGPVRMLLAVKVA